jgi:hypothetical protein
MVQSGDSRLVINEDFLGGTEVAVASTTAPPINWPPFLTFVGQGIADTDSGAVMLDSDGMNGVVQLTTTNEDVHCAGFQTPVMFDVALNGTIVMEVRCRQAALNTGEVFIGFSDVATDLAIIEGAICHGDTVTVTLTASDIVGFLMASDLTDNSDWHGVYNGGTTTGETTSTDVDFDAGATAGEYQVLRLELFPNGTVEWWVDGVLEQTVTGAVSTSVDLCMNVLVESKTTAVKTLDVDYIRVWANRDWTV